MLVQSILEGRTDCPISGVFGAGKTRAAAAMIAGLLVMDPTLKVMVVTKENAAAHAFAKHIESLQLPPSLEEKFGRLVGATELEKGPSSQTKLDIVPGYRNTVLRTKQVIIGCGGGFHQECTQPYSPVARWMADVDVALNDEGQQYGNLDEASAIARIPRKGIVIWCGDHKQTPGGLRKSEEARVFRRKLMRRPIALRGDTTFLPPHMLGAIVHPYVKDVPGPQMAGLSQLLQECTKQPLGLSTGSVNVFQDLCKETIGGCWVAGITSCCCAAIAVLWLALAPERFPLQADTFSCAAGTAGKQKWSLILPSSARVSELTYNTIIGTRYPELDNVQNDIIQFGNYLQTEQCTRGGFLPIFWDAPYSHIQACTDIGEVVDWITDKFVVHNKGDLAVLHNRNKMVNTFTNTEWVSGSGGAIISRSVTSCAGMTAFLVLLAQTRVGFLSGGRGKSFHQLPAQEQASQKCLKYGASFSGLDEQEDPVFLIRLKDDDLLESPDDSAFLQSLRYSCARVNGVYPPLALVEAYITEEDNASKVRRLHLIVVDLHRRRRMADRVLRLLGDLQVDRCAEVCLHTLYQSRGNRIKRPTNFAMSLVTQWKEVTSRATSFGRSVLQNNPSGALMPGKVIGCGWTHVLTLLRWESSTSLMLFASTHKGPGGQLQSKLWASLPAVYQRMPIWKICRGTLSRLHLGVFRLKGKHLRRSVKLITTWLQRRRGRLSVALILTVGGRECQITPPQTRNVRIWRPHQLLLTRIGSTLPMRRCRTWQMTSTTLTSHDTPEVVPARMRQEFS